MTNSQIKSKLPDSLTDIEAYFKKQFHQDINDDFIIRKLFIPALNKNALVMFLDTITDTRQIEASIIDPLLTSQTKCKTAEDIIYAENIIKQSDPESIANKIVAGYTVLFIEQEKTSYLIATEFFESRSIEKAESEVTLKGSKEAFVDSLQSNINLIRKKIKNNDLVNEAILVGERTIDHVSVLYLADLVDEAVLKKVKARIDQINVGSVQNTSVLLQYIQDAKLSIFPTILETERPDRATKYIEEGHIVLAMDHSDTVLVVPVSFWSFFHLPDDRYLHFTYGNFIRFIRSLAIFITLFTSSLYVAITNFHTEMVPADLLLAIATTREKVPFPAVVEVLLMELAFELIREAGLRVPNPIGPTIGIVGALILGQAASEANIVSPIVIIVVALSGLSSFIINNVSMNFAFRISRFVLICAGGLFGLFGIAAVFTMGLFYIVSIRSFGIPYLAPYAPHLAKAQGVFVERQMKKDIYRTPFLRQKDIQKKQGDVNE